MVHSFLIHSLLPGTCRVFYSVTFCGDSKAVSLFYINYFHQNTSNSIEQYTRMSNLCIRSMYTPSHKYFESDVMAKCCQIFGLDCLCLASFYHHRSSKRTIRFHHCLLLQLMLSLLIIITVQNGQVDDRSDRKEKLLAIAQRVQSEYSFKRVTQRGELYDELSTASAG